ncbi:olfactomedin-like protein 2B [Mugil cephalus]|uniref:olfactomedin-like protein 2B n=1 Tax=Mugil cephalus TaxID=48193 RepID=UPI001FB5C8F0|nr:olfactomedin-like protein 2B [Mugil cephalus]
MKHRLSLLILCCALSGLDAVTKEPGIDAPSAAPLEDSQRGAEHQLPETRDAQQSTDEILEDEVDNQENVISQLLGDYDKVKTLSSGSDCVCRCVVRPIKRSDCSRLDGRDPASPSQDFYTVETITKGTDCKKCVCMAPPSAVNPCEGEYRFKKLQEASKDDIKLTTIIDLLEGSLYGMDLLKLHSVTTKLLTRMDNMEKAFTRNLTEKAKEKERLKEKAKEKDKDKKTQQKKKKVNDLDRSRPKSGAAAFAHKQKNYESQRKNNEQQDGLEQQQTIRNKTETQKSTKEKNSMVIRGVTFYKAEGENYDEDEKERGKNTTVTKKTSVDHLPPTGTFLTKRPRLSATLTSEPDSKDPSRTLSDSAPTQQLLTPSTTSQQTTRTTKPAPSTIKLTTESTTTTTPKPTTTKQTTTSRQTTAFTTTTQPTIRVDQNTTSDTNIRSAIDASPTVSSQSVVKSRLSWTESPADQPKTTKKPAVCKDTVASISEPVQQNSYGLSDGAWMRDARGHGNVIYLTNGHFGDNLQEFRDMDALKSGQASNSYKLPYSFTGTGHVVFNGAFYYNRAFSRDVIRYDLRHRFVAAWTTLHDALLEEEAHKTQTEVEFAVDESGLWLLYPALDTEGFHQEVILLIHLNPRDLQPIRTFRTGLRRGRYGNSFLVCGVLYAVDSMDRHYANVTYAFDTHTFTHTVPSLAFTNMHSHTSQLAYCPLDKKLYAWDDGHQMMYNVIFAY